MNTSVDRLMTPRFLLLLVIAGIIGLSFSTYFLLPKYLALELGADAATIGGISAISMLASVAAMPLAGVYVDRQGRRPFIVGGSLLFALACAGFLIVDAVGPLLWTVRVVQGIAWPLYYIALSTLATNFAPRARMGEAIGVFGAVMISTNALGPALAEWGARVFSWSAVFGATVVAALLAALLARYLDEPPRPAVTDDGTTLLTLMVRPGLRRVLLVTATAGWTFSAVFTFYQPWALAEGFKEVSTYLVAFSACAMVVRVALGGIADRFGRLRVAKLVMLLYVASALALVWVTTLGLALTGAMLGVAHGIFFPAMNAVAVEFCTEAERGKAMGAYNAAFNIGYATSSYALGLVATVAGYPSVFVVAAATCALGAGLLATMSAPKVAQGA